ncbi:MAG: hypothetical protein ACE366_00420 [Bradymonadia bacterium]
MMMCLVSMMACHEAEDASNSEPLGENEQNAGEAFAPGQPAEDAMPEGDAGTSSPDAQANRPDAMSDIPESAPDAMMPNAEMPDAEMPARPLFEASFDGPDGAEWPAPWSISGGVESATLEDGMACLVPSISDYSLGRMHAPLGATNVEVLFTLRFSHVRRQGIGFYVRQNGAYLATEDPAGTGYAIFIEGFRGDGIGLWREVEGHEQDIDIHFNDALDLQDGVRYRVRFRAARQGDGTLLQGRIWPEDEAEPDTWQIEAQDDTRGLQDQPLGIAVDSWNNFDVEDPGPAVRGATCVDDISIRALAGE